MFGVRPTLEINGKRKYKSWCGAVFSLFVILVVFMYAGYKIVEAQTDKSADNSFLATFDADTGLIYKTVNITAVANMTQMVGSKPTQLAVQVNIPVREPSTLIAIFDALAYIGGMIVTL